MTSATFEVGLGARAFEDRISVAVEVDRYIEVFVEENLPAITAVPFVVVKRGAQSFCRPG